jgi:hypothetical protein
MALSSQHILYSTSHKRVGGWVGWVRWVGEWMWLVGGVGGRGDRPLQLGCLPNPAACSITAGFVRTAAVHSKLAHNRRSCISAYYRSLSDKVFKYHKTGRSRCLKSRCYGSQHFLTSVCSKFKSRDRLKLWINNFINNNDIKTC